MWKILCKNILALYRNRHFRVGVFYFASPCTFLTNLVNKRPTPKQYKNTNRQEILYKCCHYRQINATNLAFRYDKHWQ